MKRIKLFLTAFASLAILIGAPATIHAKDHLERVRYGTKRVDGLDIFFREAGDPFKQAVVLLHGFPSSSHQYREFLAALGDEYLLIVPDYPGYGDSSFPTKDEYTFDNVAETMDRFLRKWY